MIVAVLLIAFSCLNVGWAARPVTAGPCVLGTSIKSRNFNCTAEGYFELRQCNDKYCFCVHPANGHIADGTKTFTRRVWPRCGNCFNELEKKYSMGHTENLPLCDYDVGDYKKKQCTKNECHCVDTITGKPYKTGGPYLECETPTAAPEPLFINGNPLANRECALPKDRGFRCSRSNLNATNQPKVMWHFDKNTFRCVAFKHYGCGGNANKFATISDCWDSCLFQDFGGCAGLKEPLIDKATNESVKCGERHGAGECPKGYRCSNLAFFSVCCDEKNEEFYRRNVAPKCESNLGDPVQFKDAGMTLNLLGISCADDFCPAGSECKQLEVYAHCCPRK
uniref:Kunitz/Bovine pancreatic trypsin inhibitor domain protein n=1 Tax=Panagrellus redivivus TaxID=6233 RepID=A0A7E4V3V9_PANRE